MDVVEQPAVPVASIFWLRTRDGLFESVELILGERPRRIVVLAVAPYQVGGLLPHGVALVRLDRLDALRQLDVHPVPVGRRQMGQMP